MSTAAFLLAAGMALGGEVSPETSYVFVPAGLYEVGGEDARNPPRLAGMDGFWIARTETTNREFARFVEETGYVTDAERRGWSYIFHGKPTHWDWAQCDGADWRCPQGPEGTGFELLLDHPATQLSHRDAEEYCAWAGGRLPTVEEWEVAARAGGSTKWPWGGEHMPGGKPMANTWQGTVPGENTMADGWKFTSPVGAYPPNAWGLHDVVGNVFEYCAGRPRDYGYPRDAEAGMARGGSWWCSPGVCAADNLEHVGAMILTGAFPNQGFRIAFDADALPAAFPSPEPPLAHESAEPAFDAGQWLPFDIEMEPAAER